MITVRNVESLRADVLGAVPEMVREIQENVPEYGALDDPYAARQLRSGVDLALRRYVELIDKHLTPGAALNGGGQAVDWREIYRSAGACEMRAGRSLDGLHAAVRICARVAHRRLRSLAGSQTLPSDVVAWLAEAIFDNIDEIARASAEGYTRAQTAEAGELDRRRRRLLDLLTADPPPSEQALTAAAAAAHWRIPRRVAAVAVDGTGSPARPPLLPPEFLSAFDQSEPFLLVPDPESRTQMRSVVSGLARHDAAVGLPVPPLEAARSLRWARQALELARSGRIPHQPIIWCADHMTALVVFQDEPLLAVLAERRLAPLAQLPGNKRQQLAETLLSWLSLNMNANKVAAQLHLHPQTVRQRLRHLTDLFGTQLNDPQSRFELEIALRAACSRPH
ncbi:PucR family transcriptional regulator [Actinoplanes sp. GCM10030250]|uniref:PucR family transcriptional regulator n=1 Tax=Actinoplanes sp. GCM10030250 TaxID=3273376 RepID=UPI003622709B